MVQRETKTVKMMYQKKKLSHFSYIQELRCRVLELPYQGKELSMLLLLPDDIEDESTGLKEVLARSLWVHAPCVGVCFLFIFSLSARWKSRASLKKL